MSGKTGIELEYLILLRREIEGYFPKPPPLKAFDWLPEEEIRKLEEKGIRNAAELLEATRGGNALKELAQSAGTSAKVLEILIRLADLTRVQWVSPLAARMILEAGYSSARELAEADAEELSEVLERVNKENDYFRGKIGLRDIRRLIRAAVNLTDI